MNAAASQLQDLLGIALEAAWLQRTQLGNVNRDELLKTFLLSDLAESSTGCLPPDWQNRPQLQGTFMLQLNEVVNVAAPARDRYKPDSGRRCLKLHLTDAGCKIILTNPVVHRGYFMLMGRSVQVLGGSVPHLEAARQRLLAHWSKPLGCNLLSVQERRTFQQLMLEAEHAAWPQDDASGMQAPLIQAGARQQQDQQQGTQSCPNSEVAAANAGSDAMHLPRYHDVGAFPSGQGYSGHVPSMPHQLQGTRVCLSAGTSAPVADGHAHPAIHAHPFVQPQAAPSSGPEGARPGTQHGRASMHQHGRNSVHSHGPMLRETGPSAFPPDGWAVAQPRMLQGPPFAGQSMLPSTSWRSSAPSGMDTGDTILSCGLGTANPSLADPRRVDSKLTPGTSTPARQPVDASSWQEIDLSDVIMIDSDDDGPAHDLPSVSVGAPLGARQGALWQKGPQECESDEEAPLVSRPRRITEGKPAARLHYSGSENSSQGNREGRQVLMMETIADAISHSKAHPGLEETFQYQVAAVFQCQDVHIYDESGAIYSFYHIPGSICDRFESHDCIVKPEFLSECGLGDDPACLIHSVEAFKAATSGSDGDIDAPLVQHMEAVMDKFQSHGTLLLEMRKKYVKTWHVSLPDPITVDLG